MNSLRFTHSISKIIFVFLWSTILFIPIHSYTQINQIQIDLSKNIIATGDIKGTSYGVKYYKTIKNNLSGFLGYTTSSGGRRDLLFDLFNQFPSARNNINLEGNGAHLENIALYHSIYTGLAYDYNLNQNIAARFGVGFIRQNISNNYVSGASIVENTNGEINLMIEGNTFVRKTNYAPIININALFKTFKNIHINVFSEVEASTDMVSRIGIGLITEIR